MASELPGGEWALAREGPPQAPRWVLLFRPDRSASRDGRLPLPLVFPRVAGHGVFVNVPPVEGRRGLTLSAAGRTSSTLEVSAHPEPKSDSERDQDCCGDALDTDGPIAVTSSAAPPFGKSRSDEWMVGAGVASSIELLQGEGGRRYAPVNLSWGRDLMQDVGPGLLRGRLMWAVELTPLHWQFAPTATLGVGASPLVWRWRFVPRRRAAAFTELAFGGLFTRDPVPENTQRANFAAHGAVGVRWRPDARVSLVTAYRFQHISNGNQLSTNPGVNAHVAWLGLAVRRGPG